MWSIGALLELDDRAKMEEFLRNHEDIRLDLPQIPEGSEATMFEYLVDEKGELLKMLTLIGLCNILHFLWLKKSSYERLHVCCFFPSSCSKHGLWVISSFPGITYISDNTFKCF